MLYYPRDKGKSLLVWNCSKLFLMSFMSSFVFRREDEIVWDKNLAHIFGEFSWVWKTLKWVVINDETDVRIFSVVLVLWGKQFFAILSNGKFLFPFVDAENWNVLQHLSEETKAALTFWKREYEIKRRRKTRWRLEQKRLKVNNGKLWLCKSNKSRFVDVKVYTNGLNFMHAFMAFEEGEVTMTNFPCLMHNRAQFSSHTFRSFILNSHADT